jgi:hypothetical protein
MARYSTLRGYTNREIPSFVQLCAWLPVRH